MARQDSEAERDRKDKQGAGSKMVLWESQHESSSTAGTNDRFQVIRERKHIKGGYRVKRVAASDEFLQITTTRSVVIRRRDTKASDQRQVV